MLPEQALKYERNHTPVSYLGRKYLILYHTYDPPVKKLDNLVCRIEPVYHREGFKSIPIDPMSLEEVEHVR